MLSSEKATLWQLKGGTEKINSLPSNTVLRFRGNFQEYFSQCSNFKGLHYCRNIAVVPRPVFGDMLEVTCRATCRILEFIEKKLSE